MSIFRKPYHVKCVDVEFNEIITHQINKVIGWPTTPPPPPQTLKALPGNPIFLKTEDDLNILLNGSRPQYFENERRAQFVFEWKTTLNLVLGILVS